MATNVWISTGSTDWSVAGNWSAGSAPADDEDIIIGRAPGSNIGSNVDITAGLSASTTDLNSLTIYQSYTGAIGTETSPLTLGSNCTGNMSVYIGEDLDGSNPPGAKRINLSIGSTKSISVTVYNTAAISTDNRLAPVRILHSNSSSTLAVRNGKVWVAGGFSTTAAETSSFATIVVGVDRSRSSTADVLIGSGTTLVTLNAIGGKTKMKCAATTVNQYGGEVITEGAGAITTWTVAGGLAVPGSTGTIGTLKGQATAGVSTVPTIDFQQHNIARTVTTLNVLAACIIKYNPTYVTLTNRTAVSDFLTGQFS